jgi:hypothetical protein
MRGGLDRGDHRHGSVPQLEHGVAEALRRELHLPELVDQDGTARAGRIERRQRQPFECVEVDAIATHARRPFDVDVCQEAALAGERFDVEANPAAAFAQLSREEAGRRDPGLAQQLGQPAHGGRLPGSRPGGDKDSDQQVRCRAAAVRRSSSSP